MKLLIPFSYYFPEQCAGLYIVDDVMKQAAKNGISSMMFVPTPTRNVPSSASWVKDEISEDGMIHIHRFSMYGEGKNPLLRALRYCFCEVAYLHAMLWKKYDVAFIDSTPPIQGLKLPIVRVFRRKPVVLNLQDIFPDSLAGTGLAKRGGILWKIGRVVENITYRNADRIIVISDDFKKNIMAKGVPEEKIVVVYNWVDENAVVPVSKEDNVLYDELGINRDKFTVVYAGNFGHAQNIDVTIAAAERLKDVEDIQFLMFGTGGLVEDYKKIAQEKGLNNMFFFPLQPAEKVSQVYSLGDLGIVACKKGLGKGAFPSKTWSIMSAGTPVIANYDEDTDLERLVKDNGLGVFSAADDSEQMAECIMEMYNNRELCAEYGNNARQYILDNVSKEKSTQKYIDVIKEVVEQNRNKKSKR